MTSNKMKNIFSLNARCWLFLGMALAVAPNTLADYKINYVHVDHRGAPVAMTNDAEVVVWRAAYTPFGEATIEDDPDNDFVVEELNIRYPGQYFDQETGYHQNWNRDYDPPTGRYLQSDPIGLRGGMNTYAYVGGNPVNFVDPMGLDKQISVGINGAGQVGPFSIFGLSVAVSGGQSVGISIPDDLLNWKCYQLFWLASAFGGGGAGTFFGVGAAVSISSTSGPMPSGVNTTTSVNVIGNAGAGPSGGVTISGDSSGINGSSISGGNIGIGLGLATAAGVNTTTTATTSTIGDDCEC